MALPRAILTSLKHKFSLSSQWSSLSQAHLSSNLLKPSSSINSTNIRSFNYVSAQNRPDADRNSSHLHQPNPLHTSTKLPMKGLAVLVIAGTSLFFLKQYKDEQARLRKEQEKALRRNALYNRFNQFATHTDETAKSGPKGRKNLYTCDLFRAILNESTQNLSDADIKRLCPELLEMFHEEDIFSITDYILLTSILISPKTKFRIAFHMLDRDSSNLVTLGEFITLKDMFYSKIMSKHTKSTDTIEGTKTSLAIKFFGENQEKSLNLTEFENFAKNFQNAVFKLEYELLAEKSPDTIGVSRSHFANLILDMSGLESETKLDRLSKLEKPSEPVTFADYKAFRVLLNNLSKFKEIMKFYALADRPVKQSEMSRASKLATIDEEDVSDDIIKLLFSCYDSTPADGVMDYHDFLAAFKDDLRYRYIY